MILYFLYFNTMLQEYKKISVAPYHLEQLTILDNSQLKNLSNVFFNKTEKTAIQICLITENVPMLY